MERGSAPAGRVRLTASGEPEALTFLILARDEAPIQGRTPTALTAALGPRDQIHIVADHCRDATAAVAVACGAVVHVRTDGGAPGKGPALRWWLEHTRRSCSPLDAVVLLDADSQLGPGFLPGIRERLARGEPVIQASLAPQIRDGGPLMRLAGFSDVVEQQVYDAWKTRLKWPVRIRGTGTAFRRRALERAAARLQTSAEDLEMTLVLAAERIPITLAREVSVLDPKPHDVRGAARQRARWSKGQLHVLRAYPDLVCRLLVQGPRGWALLSSVLLKPKSIVAPLKVALTVLACLSVRRLGLATLPVAAAGLVWLGLDVIGLLCGLRFVSDRWKTLLALLFSPAFLMLWLRSVCLAAFSRDPWLRSRLADRHDAEGALGHAPDVPR
ncbi:MAG: glycosyltransferase family 2 protein [Chloroflexota bacterium]